MSPDNIPLALRSKARWVMWRLENGKKKPLQINNSWARVNDARTWTTFEECLQTLNEGQLFSGIGFVLDETDDVIGWDLDHCLDPKNLTDDVVGLVQDEADAGEELSLVE